MLDTHLPTDGDEAPDVFKGAFDSSGTTTKEPFKTVTAVPAAKPPFSERDPASRIGMSDDIFASTLSSATVVQPQIEHAEHSLPMNMDAEHASSSDTTPPHASAAATAAAAYAQQQPSFAHRALGVGQPAGTGSSASTIRPEYMNAQAHVSTVDVNDSPFAFTVPADAADGSVLPAPSYTPTAVNPRSSSLYGPGPLAFHPHHATHFTAPPVPPPRNSSLGHFMTPQSASSTMVTSQSSTSPTRVPALQLTHPTPTKRKPRTQPPSTASQTAPTVAPAADDDVPTSHGMSSESSRDSVNEEDLSKEEIEERRKARAREKGRIRQQRKRARDKQAKLEQEARKVSSTLLCSVGNAI